MATTGNPILDNPALKAALAAKMQQPAQPQGAVMPPAGLRAKFASQNPGVEPSQPITMPSAPAPVLPSAPAPQVIAPRGTSAGDEAELSRKLRTGSGISQIAGKIEGTKLGQAHPLLGKVLGVGAQGLAQLGDIGLRAVAPQIDIATPGTSLHHLADIHADQRQIAQDTENEARQAQAQAVQSEIPLREAQTAQEQAVTASLPQEQEEKRRLEDAQIQNLLHPQAKTDFAAWREQNPDAPIEDWLKLQAQSRNVTPTAGIQQQLIAAENAGDTATASKLKQQLKDLNPLGEERLGITVANQGNAGSARVDRSYQYNQGELDKVSKPVADLVMRMGRLQDTLAQNTPQADALVAPELLTVMAGGQGSGLRMNEAEISRIVGGRSNWQSLKADMNKWALDPKAARSITPEQQREIRSLVQTVNQKLMQKQTVLDQAADALVNAESPEEHRRIVAKARQALTKIDEEASQGNAPSGASDEVYAKDGKTLIGHVINGKYVPLGGK